MRICENKVSVLAIVIQAFPLLTILRKSNTFMIFSGIKLSGVVFAK